jgi:LuxR family transcriptional regulator, maltose regulon positive regulatory protein
VPWTEDRLAETEGAITSSTPSDPNVGPPRIVLTPKLKAPAVRPEQLVRPRLLRLLEEASDCKLTLVSAPTGYGKSTLLTQWRQAERANLAFAWVSVDEQDNDPVRLWRHVVEALHQTALGDDFAADVIGRLSAGAQGLGEIMLPMLINELAELAQPVVLVLDDYQFITEADCHESVAFFVEHLPENFHLILSSRSEPRLPLGRLRARGQMSEIRTEQLTFSEEEAATLLNEVMGLDIDRDDLRLLMNITEGWPAGIYLASLSLQFREDKHAFIESFGGSNRYVVDLLGEEVLARLPEGTREFLLRTSVLRSMTGPLCDEVANVEGSGKRLRELARSNLFVVPLDEQGEWYRYHHLFSDLLLYELKSDRPELVPVLHSRASSWCEREGYIESAIRYAIAAADHERTGLLIARYWHNYLFVGRTATVERWLDALPEDLVHTDAALILVKAWIAAMYGRREERARYLALAEDSYYEGGLPDGTASVESGVATIRAVFAYGSVRSIVEAAQRASALDPEQTSPQAALVRLGQGQGLYSSGDLSGARRAYEGAIVSSSASQPILRIVALSMLSVIDLDEGRLQQAESLAREACDLTDKHGLHSIPQSTLAYIALGRVLAERGNLAGAQVELGKALSVRRRFPALSPWATLLGLLALARVHSARGERVEARVVLTEARAILEPFADDAGIFTELLERQEHKVRVSNQPKGQLNKELTERELAVLRLLAGELATRQIADSLYVATSTVRTHVKSVYRKLGVSTRKEAVEEAHARELI